MLWINRGTLIRVCLLATTLLLITTTSIHTSTSLFEYREVRSIVVYAPAVSSGGGGVLSRVELAIAYPGAGRVFFSSLPYTEVETQGASRVATFIASIFTQEDYSKYDYFVLLESNTPLVGGPSAGGLITVGFIALLLNATIKPNVTMTGMINPDGTIGPVGGLKEKLEAVSSSGFKVFLIPAGQRFYRYPVYVEKRVGPLVIGRVEYQTVDLFDYGRKLGVDVHEVSNVAEALFYFTGLNLTRPRVGVTVKLSSLEELESFTSSTLSSTRGLIIDATSIASQLGRQGRVIITYLQDINNSIDNLSKLTKTYPVYTAYKAIQLYSYSFKLYWYARIYSGVDPRELLNQINRTIESYLRKVDQAPCTLGSSWRQAMTYLSWLYYLRATNTTDPSSIIDYSGNAIEYLKYAELLDHVVNKDVEFKSCPADYTVIYSHALASYTYAERILELTGSTTGVQEHVGDYLTILNYAYSNNKTSVYAATSLVIAASARAIHDASGDTQGLPSKILPVIWYFSESLNNDVALLYLDLYNEASQSGDIDLATSSILTLMGILSITRVSPGTEIALSTTPPVNSNTPTSTNTINSPSTSNNTQTSEYPSQENWGLTLLRPVIIAGVALLAAAIAIATLKSLGALKKQPVIERL